MKIIYPDEEIIPKNINIFLAGTIDNGNSKDWQKEVIESLNGVGLENNIDITIFNPRRKKWNKILSKKDLEYQIKWEQEHLDRADLIIMVLLDNAKSPISLLELGLYAESGKLLVFCTAKFWRYDNVHLTCEKYSVPLVNSTKTKDIIKEIKNIYK